MGDCTPLHDELSTAFTDGFWSERYRVLRRSPGR